MGGKKLDSSLSVTLTYLWKPSTSKGNRHSPALLHKNISTFPTCIHRYKTYLNVCFPSLGLGFTETPVWHECIILLYSYLLLLAFFGPNQGGKVLCIWLFWAPSCNQSRACKQKSHGLTNTGALWLARACNCQSLTFWQKSQNLIPFLLKEASVSSHLSVVVSVQKPMFATKQRNKMTELCNLLILTSIKRG